jgi:hypothetical protein
LPPKGKYRFAYKAKNARPRKIIRQSASFGGVTLLNFSHVSTYPQTFLAKPKVGLD